MLTASGWSSWWSTAAQRPAKRSSLSCDDPDGATLELIQLMPSQPGRLGEHS
jgi:hypothetical protein